MFIKCLPPLKVPSYLQKVKLHSIFVKKLTYLTNEKKKAKLFTQNS